MMAMRCDSYYYKLWHLHLIWKMALVWFYLSKQFINLDPLCIDKLELKL